MLTHLGHDRFWAGRFRLRLVVEHPAHLGRGAVDLSYLHDFAERSVLVRHAPLVEREGIGLVGRDGAEHPDVGCARVRR